MLPGSRPALGPGVGSAAVGGSARRARRRARSGAVRCGAARNGAGRRGGGGSPVYRFLRRRRLGAGGRGRWRSAAAAAARPQLLRPHRRDRARPAAGSGRVSAGTAGSAHGLLLPEPRRSASAASAPCHPRASFGVCRERREEPGALPGPRGCGRCLGISGLSALLGPGEARADRRRDGRTVAPTWRHLPRAVGRG